jgi:hypothetical protein
VESVTHEIVEGVPFVAGKIMGHPLTSYPPDEVVATGATPCGHRVGGVSWSRSPDGGITYSLVPYKPEPEPEPEPAPQQIQADWPFYVCPDDNRTESVYPEPPQDAPQTWWWLSFCDTSRPAGTQFLGTAVVEAQSVSGALMQARRLGCNPGGEVKGFPFVGTPDAAYCNRLLGRDEAESFPEPAGLDIVPEAVR